MSDVAVEQKFNKKDAWDSIKKDLNISLKDGKVVASCDLCKILKVLAKLTKTTVDDSLVGIVVGFIKEFELSTTKKDSE